MLLNTCSGTLGVTAQLSLARGVDFKRVQALEGHMFQLFGRHRIVLLSVDTLDTWSLQSDSEYQLWQENQCHQRQSWLLLSCCSQTSTMPDCFVLL